MLGKKRPHVFDLLGDVRALLVRVFVGLKLFYSGLRLLDFGIETVELRLVLRHALVIERLLQRSIPVNVGIGAFRQNQRLLIKFGAIAGDLGFQAR